MWDYSRVHKRIWNRFSVMAIRSIDCMLCYAIYNYNHNCYLSAILRYLDSQYLVQRDWSKTYPWLSWYWSCPSLMRRPHWIHSSGTWNSHTLRDRNDRQWFPVSMHSAELEMRFGDLRSFSCLVYWMVTFWQQEQEKDIEQLHGRWVTEIVL